MPDAQKIVQTVRSIKYPFMALGWLKKHLKLSEAQDVLAQLGLPWRYGDAHEKVIRHVLGERSLSGKQDGKERIFWVGTVKKGKHRVCARVPLS